MGIDTASPKTDRKLCGEIPLPQHLENTARAYAEMYKEGTPKKKGAADYYIHQQFIPNECPPEFREKMLSLYETEKMHAQKPSLNCRR